MRRWAPILALAALLSMVPADADLEVGVPPGSVHDWVGGYPQPAMTGIDRVPTAKVGQGSIEVTPWVREGFRPASSIFDFSGISTRDLPVELPWTRPEMTKSPKDQVVLTGSEDELGRPRLAYPPVVSDYMHWLAMATLLRGVMHPEQVSQTATLEHLVLLGTPSTMAARRAVQEAALKRESEWLMRKVGMPPNKGPDLPRHKDAYVNMLFRLAWVELASSVPYEPGRPFAPRLRWLGDEMQVAVLECSRSRHVTLRRNATTMLGKLRGEPVSIRLRELARDRDPCVRNRALAGLMERADKPSVPWLIDQLDDSDEGLVVQCVEALGRIGDPRAARPLIELLADEKRAVDVWWAVLPALARLGGVDPQAARHVVGLRTLVRALDRDDKRFDLTKAELARAQRIRPDNPDPMTRTAAVRQLGLIALASYGDADARARLMTTVEDGAQLSPEEQKKRRQIVAVQKEMEGVRQRITTLNQQMVANPGQRQQLMRQLQPLMQEWRRLQAKLRQIDPRSRWRGGRVKQGIALRHLTQASRYALCELLPRMGKPGHALLWQVVVDDAENAQLRAHAFDRVDTSVVFGFVEGFEALRKLAVDPLQNGLLRSKALARLEDADPSTALEAARSLVRAYLGLPAASLPGLKHWPVIDALRVLGRRGKHDATLVGDVIRHATAERLEADRQREQHEKQLDQQRMRSYQLDVKVFTVPPVLEVALLELGRLGDEASRQLLDDRLKDLKFPARPHAALALGACKVGDKQVTRRLVELLGDRAPFVRLMAYRALRRRTGKRWAADWIWGSPRQIGRAVKAWEELVAE